MQKISFLKKTYIEEAFESTNTFLKIEAIIGLAKADNDLLSKYMVELDLCLDDNDLNTSASFTMFHFFKKNTYHLSKKWMKRLCAVLGKKDLNLGAQRNIMLIIRNAVINGRQTLSKDQRGNLDFCFDHACDDLKESITSIFLCSRGFLSKRAINFFTKNLCHDALCLDSSNILIHSVRDKQKMPAETTSKVLQLLNWGSINEALREKLMELLVFIVHNKQKLCEIQLKTVKNQLKSKNSSIRK